MNTIGAKPGLASAHKFHGPKGVGALVVRKGTRWTPMLLGGSQERGRRPGTENVAGIRGDGPPRADYAQEHLERYQTTCAAARSSRAGFGEGHPGCVRERRGKASVFPTRPNLGFPGLDAHALLVRLDEVGICASAGSACHSGAFEPSHVLAAMGLTSDEARLVYTLLPQHP